MEDLYLIEVDALPDVVFMEAEVIHSSCCEIFWPIHTGMVVVVEFGWKVEVYVLWVWYDMPNMLYNIGALISGSWR